MAKKPFANASGIIAKKVASTIKMGTKRGPKNTFGPAAPKPDRPLSHRDRGDGRDRGGRFTGRGGYGKDYERRGLDYLEKIYKAKGQRLIRRQVKAKVEGAPNGRLYDGLVKKPDGTYTGIEIKGGSASRNRAQKTFDGLISPANPARAGLDGKEILITSMYVKKVE